MPVPILRHPPRCKRRRDRLDDVMHLRDRSEVFETHAAVGFADVRTPRPHRLEDVLLVRPVVAACQLHVVSTLMDGAEIRPNTLVVERDRLILNFAAEPVDRRLGLWRADSFAFPAETPP